MVTRSVDDEFESFNAAGLGFDFSKSCDLTHNLAKVSL